MWVLWTVTGLAGIWGLELGPLEYPLLVITCPGDILDENKVLSSLPDGVLWLSAVNFGFTGH
jgi:hypothetical protein